MSLNLKIRIKDLLFFFGYLFTGIVFLMIIGGIDQQFFRKGYPTIKVGDVMLYNEPIPQWKNYYEETITHIDG